MATDSCILADNLLTITAAAKGLVWQEWEGVFIVYQPSSTETHVFNETAACVLQCLEQGSASIDALSKWITDSLGVASGGLIIGDLAFAVNRLETLGLVDCCGDVVANP
ncbi:MAG: HPr-rel-A system PqqD family peptide chaperone [Candidatus Methylumidiphilus sp.]